MYRIPPLFDAHVHVRVGLVMLAVVKMIARFCQAAVIEPNVQLPEVEEFGVRTGAQAAEYHDKIVAAVAHTSFTNFRPLMTVLLDDNTDPRDVATWPGSGVVAAKRFPRGLYSRFGVSDDAELDDVYSALGEHGIVYSGHFEKPGIHPLYAEQEAIDDFRRIADRGIRVIFEHASTREALEAVAQYPEHAAATITPQHLWLTSEDIYGVNHGKNPETILHPDNWCRPVAKTPEDREALRVAAMSGNPRVLLGSDFAPWKLKPPEDPPAGCACYPAVLPVLATVFEQYGHLDCLENFTSGNAAKFYGIALSHPGHLLLEQTEWTVPMSIPVGSQDDMIVPWRAGTRLRWKVT